MTNEEFVGKLNAGLQGKPMCLTVGEGGTKRVMTVTGVRLKNKNNLIFDGTPFSVGFFNPLCIYSIVDQETADGWQGDVIALEVMIGGISATEAIQFVTSS